MSVYGGVATQEITELIDEIEVQLKSLSETGFDCGKREGLVFTYKRLMKMVYIDEYCENKFKEFNIE